MGESTAAGGEFASLSSLPAHASSAFVLCCFFFPSFPSLLCPSSVSAVTVMASLPLLFAGRGGGALAHSKSQSASNSQAKKLSGVAGGRQRKQHSNNKRKEEGLEGGGKRLDGKRKNKYGGQRACSRSALCSPQRKASSGPSYLVRSARFRIGSYSLKCIADVL